MNPFSRPTFDSAGQVVARRALTMGDRVYQPGEELSDADREQLTDRQLVTLWQLGQIDTLPRETAPTDAELERLTAPAAKPPVATKPQQLQRR